MHYETTLKTDIIVFVSCFTLYLLSPHGDASYLEAKTGTQSILSSTSKVEGELHVSFQTGGTKDKQDIQKNCDSECKVGKLIEIGMNDKIAGSLVYTCKENATDPVHCIIVGASILKAESGLGKRCKNNNCMGIGKGKIKYETLEEGVEDWVMRYNKYWYKAKSASFFYPSKGSVSPSRYCTTEYSSGSDIGCPNGKKHAQGIWDKLTTIF